MQTVGKDSTGTISQQLSIFLDPSSYPSIPCVHDPSTVFDSIFIGFFILFKRKHFNFKNQFRVWLNPPRWKSSCPVRIIRSTMNLGDFPETHINHRLIPTLDDFTPSDGKGKGFLSRVFGTPKGHREVAIFTVSRAVDRHLLAALRFDAVAGFQQSLGESHSYY